MLITHSLDYGRVINAARKHKATCVSFQHHVFVNFDTLKDALAFSEAVKDLQPWPVNTNRPGVPFEVIVTRWK